MLTLDVNGKLGSYELHLPTTIDEITKDYICDVTKDVKIDANYSLIGVIYRERLSTIILAARRNTKKSDIAVIPVFVKAGETSSSLINSLEPKEKLIISPSDIMLGYHISTPKNLLTINNIIDIIDGDTNIYQKTIGIKEDCYFVDFKLVPNCNIHGSYKSQNTTNIDNPFIKKLSNNIRNTNITIDEKS